MSFRKWIKGAVKRIVLDDTTPWPLGKCEYNGKPTQYVIMTPYGLFSNAPQDAFVLMFSNQGQESTKFGIEQTPRERFKNLKAGEVAIGNVITKSVVIFKENGDVDLTTSGENGDLLVTVKKDSIINIGGDATVNVTGNMTTTISGTFDFTVTGAATLSAASWDVTGAVNFNDTITTPEAVINGVNHSTHTHVINSGSSAPGPTAGPA